MQYTICAAVSSQHEARTDQNHGNQWYSQSQYVWLFLGQTTCGQTIANRQYADGHNGNILYMWTYCMWRLKQVNQQKSLTILAVGLLCLMKQDDQALSTRCWQLSNNKRLCLLVLIVGAEVSKTDQRTLQHSMPWWLKHGQDAVAQQQLLTDASTGGKHLLAALQPQVGNTCLQCCNHRWETPGPTRCML